MSKSKGKKKDERTEPEREPEVDLDRWVLNQLDAMIPQASQESEKRLFTVLFLCARLVAGEVRGLRQDLQATRK